MAGFVDIISVNRRLLLLFLLSTFWLWAIEGEARDRGNGSSEGSVPILLYHRFGPVVADSMTMTTAVFESHLKYLQDNGYKVIRLGELVGQNLQKGFSPNARVAAMTADDGHKSIYTDVYPLLKRYQVPMTLFLYPSAISNASYAMTWEQLRELKGSGLFDFQSHTFWHPNFKKDRVKFESAEYEKSVETQFRKSKEILQNKFNIKVNMLAWPFGIHDEWLMSKAVGAGYVAAFTMERHAASSADHRMALPRFLMSDTDRIKTLGMILNGTASKGK